MSGRPDDPDPPPGYITRTECASISSGIKEQLTGINTKLDGILVLKERMAVLEEKDKAREKNEQAENQAKTDKKKELSSWELVLFGIVMGFIFEAIAKLLHF